MWYFVCFDLKAYFSLFIISASVIEGQDGEDPTHGRSAAGALWDRDDVGHNFSRPEAFPDLRHIPTDFPYKGHLTLGTLLLTWTASGRNPLTERMTPKKAHTNHLHSSEQWDVCSLLLRSTSKNYPTIGKNVSSVTHTSHGCSGTARVSLKFLISWLFSRAHFSLTHPQSMSPDQVFRQLGSLEQTKWLKSWLRMHLTTTHAHSAISPIMS